MSLGIAWNLDNVLHTSLSKVLGSDRGLGLEARTETAVLGSLKTVVLWKHLDKL